MNEEIERLLHMPNVQQHNINEFVIDSIMEEAAKDSINASREKIFCWNFIDYYKNNIKGNYKLTKIIPDFLRYREMNGHFKRQDDSILICTDHICSPFKFHSIEEQIIRTLKVALHEYCHLKTKYVSKEDDSEPCYLIEDNVRVLDWDFYIKNHDFFLQEMEADLYAISKLKEKFQGNQKMQNLIDSIFSSTKKRHIDNLNNYSIDDFISKFDNIILKKPELISGRDIYLAIYNTDGTKKSLEELLDSDIFESESANFQNMFIYNRFINMGINFSKPISEKNMQRIEQAIEYRERLNKKYSNALSNQESINLQSQVEGIVTPIVAANIKNR